MSTLPNLRIVTLDAPLYSLKDEQVQRFFGKFLAAKIEGYESQYSHAILAVGSYDFISSLTLICIEDAGTLEPIAVFKNSTVRGCARFSMPFELLPVFDRPEHAIHAAAVGAALDEAAERGNDVAYTSSWTVLPRARNDEALHRFLGGLCPALLYLWATEHRINELIAGTAVRFKVDRLLATMGYEYLAYQGARVPTFQCTYLQGAESAIMRLTSWSRDLIGTADRYRSLWDNRLVICRDPQQRPAPAGAAGETLRA